MNNGREREMERRTLRNLEFKTEYLPKLRRRVARNKRFRMIEKPQRHIKSYQPGIPNNFLPRVRVQLKTNAANKAAAANAKLKGYRTTNLKDKSNHVVYKKILNGQFYNKNYKKLHHNVILKKPNGTETTVSSMLNNYNNNINIGTYVNVRPVNSKSVYLEYGHTTESKRRQKYGTNLRRLVMNAAKNAGMKLYQVSLNVEGILPHGATPISALIMNRLGAKPVSFRNVPASIRTGHSTNRWFVYN